MVAPTGQWRQWRASALAPPSSGGFGAPSRRRPSTAGGEPQSRPCLPFAVLDAWRGVAGRAGTFTRLRQTRALLVAARNCSAADVHLEKCWLSWACTAAVCKQLHPRPLPSFARIAQILL
mmetsp:Transcript_58584/g.188298  ORF Transcript_58584/g.188298 Transcript_58584/m.188298 type:complete len:120 (-) Transcript_58584:260-619(-)